MTFKRRMAKAWLHAMVIVREVSEARYEKSSNRRRVGLP
jgi:hypothetical protein